MELDNLRVLIIADDPLARTGLATLLAGQSGCVVVGQVAGDAEAPASLAVYQPDVVLWDLGWSRETFPAEPVDLDSVDFPLVVLLADPQQAAAVWSAGARGILLREVGAGPLAAALQAVAHGLVTLDPSLSDVLVPSVQLNSASLVEPLTPRETEVLQYLAEGLTNKSIALHLNISEHTVKFHVNAIMTKLGAQSRTEAVVRATQLGLILF